MIASVHPRSPALGGGLQRHHHLGEALSAERYLGVQACHHDAIDLPVEAKLLFEQDDVDHTVGGADLLDAREVDRGGAGRLYRRSREVVDVDALSHASSPLSPQPRKQTENAELISAARSIAPFRLISGRGFFEVVA